MQQTSIMPVAAPANDQTEGGFLPWVADLVRSHRARLVSYARVSAGYVRVLLHRARERVRGCAYEPAD